MNNHLRFALVAFSAAMSLSCWAQQEAVVMELMNPADAPQVATDYGVPQFEVAGSSPFARMVAPFPMTAHQLEAAMTGDLRIKMVEEEAVTDYPEDQSSRGSTVAAVFDPNSTYARNTGVWDQIGYTRGRYNIFKTVRVGIVDNGLSIRQRAIWQKVVASRSFLPDAKGANDQPMRVDTNGNGLFDEAVGHGTMVAGIVYQLAPQARFVIAKVADSDGRASSWNALRGIVYAVDNQCQLINFSMGSVHEIVAFQSLTRWAFDHGSLVVSAAGNEATPYALYPSNYAKVVCVTGLLPDSTKAPFSCWDDDADVAAPATGIESAWWTGESAVWSGTSFSAPLVTGVVASALTNANTPTPSILLQKIVASGDNINAQNPLYTNKLGRGLNSAALIWSLSH